jgi:hypothetical protein
VSPDTPSPQPPPPPWSTPVPAGETPDQDPYVLTIGDIGVTRDQRIVTPNGVGLLAGSTWIVQDMSQTTRDTPTWAVVLCVLTVLETFGLGLLFLLVKEQKTTGSVQVQVRNEKLFHITQMYVRSPMQVNQIQQQVRQAQIMAAAAATG